MSVRITLTTRAGCPTVRIEGRLLGADAEALKDELAATGSAPAVDLSGLMAADESAIDVLVALEAAGADLIGASTYIRYLLDRACLEDPRAALS